MLFGTVSHSPRVKESVSVVANALLTACSFFLCRTAHILNTRRYATFCASLGDGSFIHHEPGAGGVDAYAETLNAYRATFQAHPIIVAAIPQSCRADLCCDTASV